MLLWADCWHFVVHSVGADISDRFPGELGYGKLGLDAVDCGRKLGQIPINRAQWEWGSRSVWDGPACGICSGYVVGVEMYMSAREGT